MKIVLAAKSVYPFHPFGGVQKYVYYFAKHLKAQGIDVEIVAPLDDGQPRSEVFEGITYTLIGPSISSYLELPVGWVGVHLFARQLAKYLETQDFDILHSFDLTGLYYLDVPNRKPVIAHIFSDNYLCNPITIGKYLSLFGYKPHDIKKTKIAISPTSGIATIAQYPAQYFLKTKPMHRYLSLCEMVFVEGPYFLEEVNKLFKLNSWKTRVVAVGTDISYVNTNSKSSSLLRQQMGISNEDLVLLTVNRLAADKGIDQIIKALKIIRQKRSAKLIVVGKGYQEKELLDLITLEKLTDHVRLVKDVKEDELYGYYQISNVYVCAFSFPGSSISTLEAMAVGLPIITTAQSWLVNGQNGVFIQDNEPNTIAMAVESITKKDLQEQGNVSKEIVRDYDWPCIVQKAQEYYREINDSKVAKK
jgi:glycosyltransferase involved in cell wall biosynthesis